jgi:lipopolysaccharide transport protein LptA
VILRLCLLFLASTSFAFAQDAPIGFDPNKRTKIDAERVERGPGGRTMIGEGGVTISQPGVVLQAERMELFVDPATNAIERVIATGRVRYANVTGDAIAGMRAVYVAAENSLTVTGDVVVLQEDQIATAEVLIYNVETGAMTMRSGPSTRVRGLIRQSESR